ncbi:MAG: proteasome accessory factor PafA2 family protein [Deltaproteobacteria bacterium]|nr:proteasome accessory factor PafA2 family protein [Deltaproteobacteria bacterium]MBW2362726.1 proteasome accessory factor PafA2 family protein [Deltaproteobacteria bacterium]
MHPDRIDSRNVPKLVGADFELANFIQGLERAGGTGHDASEALLAEIEGVPASGGGRTYTAGSYVWGAGSAYGWSQDQGRKFLATNGGCAYIDLDHLELCIPEVRSAFDHAAASMAMLRIARRAQVAANEHLPEGQSLQVLVNNSDGRSNSYGSHLNFLVSRDAWDDILERRPHYLQFLAAHQLSSMIYSGQGKVGSENDRPDVAYQISQRADFIETTTGTQTTYRRPIVNSRDENLCGKADGLARLHVIFFDNTLCSGASVLKVGAMQIVLALLEAQAIDGTLGIDVPVAASVTWSHDPTLQAKVRLVDGGEATALGVQRRILETAQKHHATRGLPGVPRADEILALWEDTLDKLAARDFDALVGRLDWVLKQQILERALEADADLSWKAPQLEYLNQIYSSLDPAEGLYWSYARAGLVEDWVSEEAVTRFEHEPPEDTRAWTRARLLRHVPAESIEKVDWDHIRLSVDERGFRRHVEVRLDDPLGFTREHTAHLFDEGATQRSNS